MCAHEYPWALMSMMLWCHEHSRVQMSAHSFMAPCSWLLLSSHECSLLHGTIFMGVYGCWSIALIGNYKHSWLLLAAYECSWVQTDADECSWLLMKLMNSHEHSWVWCHGALITHENSRAFISMAPWGRGRKWESPLHHSTKLMGAPECLWSLMRSHKCWTAWLNNDQKMLTFKMTSR